MELKQFIKTAITDITESISELQNELGNDSVVSPPMPSSIALKTLKQEGKHRLISKIDFDVSVVVGNTDTFEGKAKAGIQIFSAKISGGNEAKTENVSRLTFSIPILFPTAEFVTDIERSNEAAKEFLRRSRPDRTISVSVEKTQED